MATANTAVKQLEGFVSVLDFSITNYSNYNIGFF